MTAVEKARLGFIGTGTITEAIVTGILAGGGGTPDIIVSPRSAATTARLAALSPQVEIAHDIFQRFDTRAKLLAAVDDPKFVKQHGHHFYLAGQERRRVVREGGYVIGTIVRKISWKGTPMPGARIDDNSIVVPDFGTIHFGEILITAAERRVSMLRLALGSPEGGAEVYSEVATNGTWSI